MFDTPSIVIKFNLEVNLAKGLGPVDSGLQKKLKKYIWDFNILHEKIKKQFIWIL